MKALYLIDGFSDPPEEWERMKLELRREFPDLYQYVASHEDVNTQDWAWNLNYEAIVIGHSLGAHAAALASIVMKPHILIGIDPVAPFWRGRALVHAAQYALSLRRSKWLGPRGCDLAIARRVIIPDSGHNNIIEKATPSIVEFLKKIN